MFCFVVGQWGQIQSEFCRRLCYCEVIKWIYIHHSVR